MRSYGALIGLLALLAGACTSSAPTDTAGADTSAPADTTVSAQELDPTNGGADDGHPASERADSPDPLMAQLGFDRCSRSTGLVSADPSFYRDEPVHLGEQPPEALVDWAKRQPGFEEIWIDGDHNNWFVLGFSEGDITRLQSAVEAEFPATGAAVASVSTTNAYLDRLSAEVIELLNAAGEQSYSVGGSVASGIVSVDIGVLDVETVQALEPVAGEPICLTGADPRTVNPDRPQALTGDGWRLLGTVENGRESPNLYTSQDDLDQMNWATSTSEVSVDFETEVAIRFGLSLPCTSQQLRFTDVVVQVDPAVVYAETVLVGPPPADCDTALRIRSYVVAVSRDRLPAGPFFLQLYRTKPRAGSYGQRILVDTDLTVPGALATPGDIKPNPDKVARDERRAAGAEPNAGPVIAAGGYMEPGPGHYRIGLECRFDRIGPINNIVWRATTPNLSANPPPEWTQAAGSGDFFRAEIELAAGSPPSLTVTAGDHSERYEPAPAGTTANC